MRQIKKSGLFDTRNIRVKHILLSTYFLRISIFIILHFVHYELTIISFKSVQWNILQVNNWFLLPWRPVLHLTSEVAIMIININRLSRNFDESALIDKLSVIVNRKLKLMKLKIILVLKCIIQNLKWKHWT